MGGVLPLLVDEVDSAVTGVVEEVRYIYGDEKSSTFFVLSYYSSDLHVLEHFQVHAIELDPGYLNTLQ